MAGGSEYRMGDAIAGRYLIESKVGDSPAAAIYLANENHSSQKLALKIFHTQASSELLSEPDFFLKAAVQATLQHHSLAQVFEVLDDQGHVVVAREMVEGETFEAFARRSDSQGGMLAKGMEWIWQVAQGLVYLHENQCHLRIHPQNLILSPLGAKLVDADPRALPLSDLVPQSLPIRGEFRGYHAPEARERGFVAYPNSDLYGLAGLLFRLVAGKHPGEDFRQNHLALQSRRVDREIEAFIGKAMHPRSEDRFASADSFSESLWALQPFLERLQSAAAPTEFGPPPVAAKAQPFTPPPPATPAASRQASGLEAPPQEATLFGSAPPPSPFMQPVTQPVANPASDTLFGSAPPSPPAPPARLGTDFFPKPETPIGQPSEFSFKSPVPSTSPFVPPAYTPKPAPVNRPIPKPAAPPPARMSSLESDSVDLTLSGSETGLTQFGFKGANGDRTGDYGQELVRKKRRLILTLSLAALAGIAVLMIALYFVLRAAAPKPQITPADILPSPPATQGEMNAPAAFDAEPPAEAIPPHPTPAATPSLDQPPFPEARPMDTPAPEKAADIDQLPPAAGNGKLSATRQAEIEAAFKTHRWPASARDRLQMADDFNDLGRLAEANHAYQKALEAGDATAREKTLALGGLAITHKNMGMKAEALRAVEALLALNPKNRFALGLKAELQ